GGGGGPRAGRAAPAGRTARPAGPSRSVVVVHAPAYSESAEDLVERIRDELRARFAHGERPAARDYLERLPRLREDHSVALSLIYEEFCLLEEAGECPEPEDFCRRYARWKDS